MSRRLLLLNTDLEIGGTPTVVRELAKRLHQPPKVHVEVACLSGWGPVADQLTRAGITVTPLGAKGAKDLWIIRRLIDIIQDRHVDTVFSFLVHANAIAAAAKPSCPPHVRFFQSIQTTQVHPAWHWHVQRFVHHAAERVIVPSASVARVTEERARVPREKLVVIPNAVDTDQFARSQPPRNDPRPYPVGFLGRLDPVKMVPDLVAATGLLGPRVHLDIFGDGPDRQAVERAVRLLKVGSRVTLHGPVAGPMDALGEIGVLVLPSVSEGMPMTLIEAMAAGVPVVGRDVPGVRDVIDHEVNGLLAKSLLIPDLAAAIARIVDDPDLRRRLIEGGLQRVREQYVWERVMPSYRRALFGEAT